MNTAPQWEAYALIRLHEDAAVVRKELGIYPTPEGARDAIYKHIGILFDTGYLRVRNFPHTTNMHQMFHSDTKQCSVEVEARMQEEEGVL